MLPKVQVDSNIELTFSEAVYKKSGNIYIKKSTDESLVEIIDVTSNQVEGSGTNVIKINPINDFESFSKYYVLIDSSAFDDLSNNSFSGINDKTSFSFTTDDVLDPLIIGPSGIAGDIENQINLKENSVHVFTFEADENVNWSISGGDDSADFSIDEESGELVFNIVPDFETPADIDKNRIHEITIRATDNFDNFSEQSLSVVIEDIGEKENQTDNHYKLSYVNSQDSLNEEIFTTQHGNLVENVGFSRLPNPIINNDHLENFSIGKTTLNLSLNLDTTSINDTVELSAGLGPLLDEISRDNNYLSYYSLSKNNFGEVTSIKPFNYDPRTKQGARFYDLDNDSSADIVQVRYVDGEEEDNDLEINGTTKLNPTTVASVDLKPIFGINNSILQVKDQDDSNFHAALNLRAEIISKAESVNQIGYLVLNPEEDEEISYNLIKNRGNILLSNLERNGLPDITDIAITKDINLINGQKIVIFEVVDDTLESLLENYSSIDEFGKKFNLLEIKNLSNSKQN